MNNAPKTERNEAIRTAHADGISIRWLAAFYGLTETRVRQIVYAERERARRERRKAELAAAERAREAV